MNVFHVSLNILICHYRLNARGNKIYLRGINTDLLHYTRLDNMTGYFEEILLD